MATYGLLIWSGGTITVGIIFGWIWALVVFVALPLAVGFVRLGQFLADRTR